MFSDVSSVIVRMGNYRTVERVYGGGGECMGSRSTTEDVK